MGSSISAVIISLICSSVKGLSNSYVRVEVICDRKGFWLKPHCDIKEKQMSCLLFVNKFNESEDLGTDFYDEKLNKIKTLPYLSLIHIS